MMFFRHYLVLLAALWLSLLSGCATESMLQSMDEDDYYQEKISSVSISGAERQMVVLGEKYHYLIDLPSKMEGLFDPEIQPWLENIYFSQFKVSSDSKINGLLNVDRKYNAPEWVYLPLRDIMPEGVTYNSIGQLPLQGMRYTATPLPDLAPRYMLSKTYTVTILEVKTSTQLQKAALSPITVAADGAVLLGALVTAPLWYPVLKDMRIGF